MVRDEHAQRRRPRNGVRATASARRRPRDGVRATATGAHLVEIAWGKMTRLLILPDTAALKSTLEGLAKSGNAATAPIADAPGWPAL